MDANALSDHRIALRPPETVMRLARMGSFHQSRLSFMRILLRRLKAEGWRFDRPVFEIDARGVGHAVYCAHGPARSYSLVAFAHDLPPEKRSDRVIAEAWDATFALFDGIPGADDIDRLSQNVPLQEAGRITERELSLSRANRSVRLFDHVVGLLAEGRQPDIDIVESVGYLMRTTAVYGSGKFGAADRDMIADRPELSAPFQAEMLSVWLTRAFVLDLVEYMARARAPETAVTLDPALRRRFGIGNSTGLGMAPYIINHPMLLNNWIAAREEALARVRSLSQVADREVAVFRDRLARAQRNAAEWHSDHPVQTAKIADLRADIDRLIAHLGEDGPKGDMPWNNLWLWAEDRLSVEGQEQLAALLLEPYPGLVDGLADCMAADEGRIDRIDGSMTLAELRGILENAYGWALQIDWNQPENQARAWYVSEEKLEPRLGQRFEEPVAEYEQPLAPGRDAAALYADIRDAEAGMLVAAYLLRHPQHRHIVLRAQIAERCPYAEIRDNTIGATLLPIDMLRCKLSFFGAGHFDPRSDRWVRINMFRGAPFPQELATCRDDEWAYPELEDAGA
jgi:hypothetical protein